jgi:hypothetical protein
VPGWKPGGAIIERGSGDDRPAPFDLPAKNPDGGEVVVRETAFHRRPREISDETPR